MIQAVDVQHTIHIIYRAVESAVPDRGMESMVQSTKARGIHLHFSLLFLVQNSALHLFSSLMGLQCVPVAAISQLTAQLTI